MAESFKRITISFYRYVIIDSPEELRDELYKEWDALNIFGRSGRLQRLPRRSKIFENMPIKKAVEDDGKSFYKLKIKVRSKIVADGLDDGTFDVTNVGKHLSAKEFNEAMNDPDSIVVDMRNHYESEVGHFENAIDYVRQIKAENLENRFRGKNFVFDERLGEKISNEIISECHQCGEACDTHTNCANDDCHLLFIQCKKCAEKYAGCCTQECQHIASLPIEDQRKLRKGKEKPNAHAVFKSRLRPNLKNILTAKK